MNANKTLILLGFIISLFLFGYIDKASAIDGVYTEVPGHKFSFDGKKVEVIEFLSFYCGHCYQFERAIPVIKGNFPKKIIWKTVPVYWGKGSPKPGEAYLLAVDEGKGEQMKKALFKAIFVEKKDIGKLDVLEDLASKIGLGFDFSMKLRAGAKAEQAQKSMLLLKSYNVQQTPTIIIAGNLKTNPGDLLGNMDAFKLNAISIIKSILGE